MKKDLFLSLFSVAIVAVTGVLVNSFLSRNLTTSDFGYFSTLFLILSMTMLLDGFKPVVTFYVSKNKTKTIGTLFFLTLVFSVLGGVLGFFYVRYIAEKLNFIDIFVMVLAIILNVNISFFWGVLEGVNKVGLSKLIRGVSYSGMYLTMSFFVCFGLGVGYFSYIILFFLFLLLIVFICLTPNNFYSLISFDRSNIKSVFLYSKENLIFNVIVSVMYVLDRSILSRISGLSSLAVYSSQYELAIRGNLFASTLSNILFPLFAKKRIGNIAYEHWKHITICSLIFFFSITSLVFFFSRDIIFLYLGDNYVEWSNLLKILIVAVYMNCFGYFSIAFLRARGDFKTYVYFYSFSLILACLFVYPLIKYYSVYGAAITYLIIRLGDVFIFAKSLKKKDIKDFLFLSIPLPLFLINYFFDDFYVLYFIYLLFIISYYKSSFLVFKSFFIK